MCLCRLLDRSMAGRGSLLDVVSSVLSAHLLLFVLSGFVSPVSLFWLRCRLVSVRLLFYSFFVCIIRTCCLRLKSCLLCVFGRRCLPGLPVCAPISLPFRRIKYAWLRPSVPALTVVLHHPSLFPPLRLQRRQTEKTTTRSRTTFQEFDLEAEEYVPLPKGEVHKKKEVIKHPSPTMIMNTPPRKPTYVVLQTPSVFCDREIVRERETQQV